MVKMTFRLNSAALQNPGVLGSCSIEPLTMTSLEKLLKESLSTSVLFNLSWHNDS